MRLTLTRIADGVWLLLVYYTHYIILYVCNSTMSMYYMLYYNKHSVYYILYLIIYVYPLYRSDSKL